MAKSWEYLPSIGGLETIKPIDKISDISASECENIDMSEEGLIQSSAGYRVLANEISGGGEVLRMFVYRKALGTKRNIILKNTDDGSNSAVYWLNTSNTSTSDGKWELLIGSLTQGAVMGFAPVNGDENEYQNRLIMCNGEDDFTVWNGATGTVASVTANTIVINETIVSEGFDTSSGSIVVDGTEYAYTGTSASTFTGVTPNPTVQNPSADSGVAQAPDDTSYAESSYTADTISFDASNGYIEDSASGFGALGTPDTVRVVGAGEFENNYIFKVDTIAAGRITLDTAGAAVVDETAGESITIFTGNPKGNILLVDQRKLFLTNGKDNKLFYSRSGDATTFFPTSSGLGSAGFLTLLENSGDITLLEPTSRADSILIHKENGVSAYSRSTDGTNTIESFESLSDAEGSGATNLKASSRYNQASYFITNVNGLNSASKALNDSSLNIDSFSEKILPTIKSFDFNDGSVIYYPDKRCLYVAGKDADASANNKQIAFYLRKDLSNRWVTDISIDNFNISDYAVLDNVLYAGSSLNQNVYKMFDTKSKNGSAIKHKWTSKEFTLKSPANMKELDTVFIEGFLGEKSKVKITILYGPYGMQGQKSKVLSWDNSKYVYQNKISTLGTDVLGTLPLGSRAEDILDSYFFSVPIAFDEIRTNRFKIKIETEYDNETTADSYWAITNIGFKTDGGSEDTVRILNINE